MVVSEPAADEFYHRVVIQPNRSLNWRQSMWFVIAVAVMLGVISAVFAAKGLWMILPFAGLEVAVLAYCTYRVAIAGMRCEVVSVNDSQVLVEKGHRKRHCSRQEGPDSAVSFPRAWVRVELREQQGWYPKQLLISASGKQVELGNFLAEEEKIELADELKRLLANK